MCHTVYILTLPEGGHSSALRSVVGRAPANDNFLATAWPHRFGPPMHWLVHMRSIRHKSRYLQTYDWLGGMGILSWAS